MKLISEETRIRRGVVAMMLAATALGVVVLASETAEAQLDPCIRADLNLALYGRGDVDQDDLSNCREMKVLFTNPKDFDTDSDDEPDGIELEDGTDPLDADSDDDGVDDGVEVDQGTDPTDADSDNDGEVDGLDDDPDNDLGSKIEGLATSLTCPDEVGSPGTIVVLGISINIDGTTDFDGADDCTELSAKFAAAADVAVEVEVVGTLGSFTATELEVEDADNDGSPDEIDDDDDNDGTDDDEDEDDDGDGEGDDEDEGEEDEEDEEDEASDSCRDTCDVNKDICKDACEGISGEDACEDACDDAEASCREACD